MLQDLLAVAHTTVVDFDHRFTNHFTRSGNDQFMPSHLTMEVPAKSFPALTQRFAIKDRRKSQDDEDGRRHITQNAKKGGNILWWNPPEAQLDQIAPFAWIAIVPTAKLAPEQPPRVISFTFSAKEERDIRLPDIYDVQYFREVGGNERPLEFISQRYHARSIAEGKVRL